MLKTSSFQCLAARSAAGLLVAVSLAGCGAMQGAKTLVKATFFPSVETLKLTTQCEPVTNADDRGAALPVTVRVYQLSDTTQLTQTDYASLIERDQEALGNSLVQRNEYVAYPQSTSQQEFAIKPGTRFLAVLAVMRKAPAPTYYLLDASRLESSGITLKIDARTMLMTAGPTPLNKGFEGAPDRPAGGKPADAKGA